MLHSCLWTWHPILYLDLLVVTSYQIYPHQVNSEVCTAVIQQQILVRNIPCVSALCEDLASDRVSRLVCPHSHQHYVHQANIEVAFDVV